MDTIDKRIAQINSGINKEESKKDFLDIYVEAYLA
jgi:hypothetical protein